MRILLVHRYFWPDTPSYAQMLNIMARHFVDQGHDVTVFSAHPGYNESQHDAVPSYEEVEGVKIHRTWLFRETKKAPLVRAINVLIFCASLFVHCLLRWRRYDLMTVASFPPTVMGLVARAVCFFTRSKYLFHCQDLYPEVAQASGIIRRPFLAKLAAWNDRNNVRKAAAVVVLSEDMKQTIAARGVPVDNVHIINNFIIDRLDTNVDVPIKLQKPSGKFRVLFAGNIGRFQSLDKLIGAMKLLADKPDIELAMVGGGAMIDSLKEQAGERLGQSIHFFPFQPLDVVMKMIHNADLSVTSLTPGVILCAYPSKTMTYVEAGSRMLAIIETESELANLIEAESLGVVCGEPTEENIADCIASEYEGRTARVNETERIRTIGDTHFGQNKVLGKWSDLLARMEK